MRRRLAFQSPTEKVGSDGKEHQVRRSQAHVCMEKRALQGFPCTTSLNSWFPAWGRRQARVVQEMTRHSALHAASRNPISNKHRDSHCFPVLPPADHGDDDDASICYASVVHVICTRGREGGREGGSQEHHGGLYRAHQKQSHSFWLLL